MKHKKDKDLCLQIFADKIDIDGREVLLPLRDALHLAIFRSGGRAIAASKIGLTPTMVSYIVRGKANAGYHASRAIIMFCGNYGIRVDLVSKN